LTALVIGSLRKPILRLDVESVSTGSFELWMILEFPAP
jgi:hypothetical protein